MSIDHWVKKRAVIIPHLEFPKLYSFEELGEIAKGVKAWFAEKSPEIKVSVLNHGPIYELDGEWCVCLRFDFPETTKEQAERARRGRKKKEFWYLLRQDKVYNKSFGSPFYVPIYGEMRPLGGYTSDDDPENELERPVEFRQLEGYLKERLGGTNITQFRND